MSLCRCALLKVLGLRLWVLHKALTRMRSAKADLSGSTRASTHPDSESAQTRPAHVVVARSQSQNRQFSAAYTADIVRTTCHSAWAYWFLVQCWALLLGELSTLPPQKQDPWGKDGAGRDRNPKKLNTSTQFPFERH